LLLLDEWLLGNKDYYVRLWEDIVSNFNTFSLLYTRKLMLSNTLD
jgi:hypothetical protein